MCEHLPKKDDITPDRQGWIQGGGATGQPQPPEQNDVVLFLIS